MLIALLHYMLFLQYSSALIWEAYERYQYAAAPRSSLTFRRQVRKAPRK